MSSVPGAARSSVVRGHPRIAALVACNTVSMFGSAVSMLAFTYVSYVVTGSLLASVATMAAQALPAPVLLRPAKALAVRFDLRWVSAWVSLAKLVLFCGVGIIVWQGTVTFWLLLLTSLANGIIGALAFPAWRELLAQIVPSDQLARLNATVSSWSAIAGIVGVIAGGVILDAWGVASLFFINGISYLAMLVVLAFPPMRTPPAPGGAGRARDALRLVRDSEALRRFVIIALVLQLIAWPIFKVLPAIASDVSPDATVFSLLLACIYVGMALVEPVLRWREKRYSHARMVVIATIILMVATTLVALAPVALAEVRVIALMLVLVPLGLALNMSDTLVSAAVQSAAPGEREAVVLAMHSAMLTVAAPIGAIAITSIAGAWNVWAAVLIEALGIGILVVYLSRKRMRRDVEALLSARPELLRRHAIHTTTLHAHVGDVEPVRMAHGDRVASGGPQGA